MTQGNMGASIMGGQNDPAYLRSRNTNGRNIYSMHTHRRVGHSKSLTDPATNNTVSNEYDTNADTCYIGQNFIPIAYTNWSADVYAYSEAYKPIKNVPIVSGDTVYDHTDGNHYILGFHEYLDYSSHTKNRLIKPNHIRSNCLDFYDNPAKDEDFYVELYDNLKIPLQFKETKCTFLLCVPTWQELETCQNFDMTSDHKWNPQSIDLNKIRKISQARRFKRFVFRVKRDTV